MLNIVVGGQINKKEIAEAIRKLAGGKANVEIKNDLDAAMEMKKGNYDYYVGACNTGGGGALAMVIALLGAENCSTISMPGNIKDESFIRNEVRSGKKAFGFTAQHADHILPILIDEFMNER